MLTTALKYDFRSTFRLLLPVLGAAIVLSVLVGFGFRIGSLDAFSNSTSMPGFLNVLLVIFIIAGFVAMTAAAVVGFIIIFGRFYTSMFCDEGYLTHTLPIKIDTLLASKFITVFVSILISMVAATIALFGLLLACRALEFSAIVDFFRAIPQVLPLIKTDLAANGYSLFGLSLVLIIDMLLDGITGILTVFLALTIACTIVQKLRLLIGVIIYIGLNIVIGIIYTAVILFLAPNMEVGYAGLYVDVPPGMHLLIIADIIVSALIAAGMYFATRFLIKNHLNLIG